jgi:pimeloyl-ACP methyl ester carboxylesterase
MSPSPTTPHADSASAPRSLWVPGNGLRHHVLHWSMSGSPIEPTGAAPPVAILLHGYMDAAGTWDRVAPRLADAGMDVFAPDARGFGDGPRVPEGGYYHFADYVADLAALVDALAPAPMFLVGHSMGGSVATLFSGAFPERVKKLALLEGLGPPDNDPQVSPDRMRRWVEQVRDLGPRDPRPLGTLDDAFRRLCGNHPGVDPEILRTRLPHLMRPLEDGRYAWKFDPLHRTTSPTAFMARTFNAFAARVTCPVLAVSGGPTGFHPPDEEERLSHFRSLSRARFDDAGHMMHWTHPEALSARLVSFFRGEDPPR